MKSCEGDGKSWPDLPYESWQDTCATLQLWTQIVGKIRLSHTPWLNHSWHVTLYLTARGLTTSAISCRDRVFQIDFDFIDHVLRIETSDRPQLRLPLKAQPVADFYATVMAALADLGISAKISEWPNEVSDRIRFSEDRGHAAYDPEYANRFWRALSRGRSRAQALSHRLDRQVQPGAFLLGSFDLAVTVTIPGRRAPFGTGRRSQSLHAVVREAYSHEVSSAGFWPGGGLYQISGVLFLRLSRAPAFPALPLLSDQRRRSTVSNCESLSWL